VQAASTTDIATREAAIAAVQRGHATQICDRLAEALETAAPRVAESQRTSRRVAADAPDQGWCNFLVGQWSMFLAMAWYVASFNDETLREFLDAMWSGFAFYEALYTQQC
jgi:hypothetical protein